MVLVTIPGGYRCIAETLLGVSHVGLRRSSAAGSVQIPQPILFKIVEFLSWHPAGMGPVVATGEIHSCAVTSEGRLACFGSNLNGQCAVPAGIDEVVAVGAGMEHTSVVTSQGRLVCFGSGSDGQCTVPEGPDDFIAVAAGTYHTCAITTQRRLVCFGWNQHGQCAVPEGLDDIVAVAACTFHTCALTSAGRLVCFGSNDHLQCSAPRGLRDVIAVAAGEHHTCAVTSQGHLVCFGSNRHGQCRLPEGLRNIVAVAAGRGHTCAVTSHGRLVCFGENRHGQCNVPTGLRDVMTVAAGTSHTFAITAQGSIACFGSNRNQQCDVPRRLVVLVAPAPRILQQAPERTAEPRLQVIQEVPQAEPAARITPTEAEEIARQLWTGNVLRLASGHAQTRPFTTIRESSSSVSENTSTLTLLDTQECLLADALVWATQGVVSVVGLQPGFELRSGRPGHAAIVQSTSVFQARERNVVTLHVGMGNRAANTSLTVTSSHTVMARHPGQGRYRPMLASELQSQDLVRTPKCELTVAEVEHDVIIAATVEIRLVDTRGSFFTGMREIDIDPYSFVEVCGALAPLDASSVQLLQFQRFDKFLEIICRNPELASCRDDLEEAGFDTALEEYGLGRGRLLVPARLAPRAIMALHQHCEATGSTLNAAVIVVSHDLKSTVCEQVAALAPRNNPLVRSLDLPLGPRQPRVQIRNTFAELAASSSSSGAVARSS